MKPYRKEKIKQIVVDFNEQTTRKSQRENKFTQISLLLSLPYGNINNR